MSGKLRTSPVQITVGNRFTGIPIRKGNGRWRIHRPAGGPIRNKHKADFYIRKAALAKANPPPEPIKYTNSPDLTSPFSQASLKAIGMQAEPV